MSRFEWMAYRHALVVPALAVLFALTVPACGGGDNNETDPPVPAGPVELTGVPAPAVSAVAAGRTIDIDVPVSADTREIAVELILASDNTTVGGSGSLSRPAGTAETATVTVSVSAASALGSYYPALRVARFESELLAGTFTAYEAGGAPVSPGDPYTRSDWSGGSPAGSSATAWSIPLIDVVFALAAEGSDVSPVALAAPGDLPYAGQVDTTASYYALSGLAAGTSYTIGLTGMADDANLYAYDVSGFPAGSEACTASGTGARDACAATSDGSGNLWVLVDGSPTLTGTTFTLDALASEGSDVSPAALAFPVELPYSGQVDPGQSYYAISGLAPSTDYTLSIAGMTDDANLYVYNASGFPGGGEACAATAIGTADDACTATADGSGNLWVRVDGAATFAGTRFTLEAAVSGTFVAEGSSGAPQPVAVAALPYTGQVDTTQSYYVVSVLGFSSPYVVSITGMADDADVYVYGADTFAGTELVCGAATIGLSDECPATSDPGGYLWILVDGTYTAAGTGFTLNVVAGGAGGFLAEGTSGAPDGLAYPGAFPYAGQVDTTASYYAVSGLAAGTAYTVTISGLAGDADLYVYGASGFASGDLLCFSADVTATESCPATSDGSGNLWVKVDGQWSDAGTAFTLDLTP